MSATDNREWKMSDFLRYKSGEMADNERNAFERMLQRDPFAAEALEGLELVSPEEAENDLASLTRRVTGRGRTINRFYYSAAAVVVLLLGIASLLVFRNAPRHEMQLAGDSVIQPAVTDTLPAISPLTHAEKASSAKAGEVTGKQAAPVTAGSGVAVNKMVTVSDTIVYKAVADTVATGYAQGVRQPARVEVAGVTVKGTVAEDALRAKAVTAALQGKVSGLVISSEDSLPIPGAIIIIKGTTIGTVAGADGRFTLPVTADTAVTLVANFIGMETAEHRVKGTDLQQISMKSDIMGIDEVVVVGYGSQKKTETDVFYKAPLPVDGYSEFYSYLEKSLEWPGEATGLTRAVVVVDMPVSKYGVRGLPVIVRSPGDSFSAEAKRVINMGPEWVPAIRNNQVVDDTVRIRIVFRRE